MDIDALKAKGDAALAQISNALDDLQYSPDQRPVPLLRLAMDYVRDIIAEIGQEVGAVADSELPGMWSASDFTGGDPDERCHAERVPVSAQEAFTTWFCLNYPGPHTIISDPNWHAPRIFRQAQWAIKQSSPAHTSEARDADAARYAFLRDSVACSLSISHNDHHNMYMSVADTFDSTDGYYNDIGNDERAKMIETDTIWTLHVYPNTPVGFNVYHGSSLDAVCDAAMRQEAGSRE